MALYQGVLETLSGGEVVSSEPYAGTTRIRPMFGGVGGVYKETAGVRDPHRGWVNRQYVDIGGQRLVNVMVNPLHDELLKEALGHEVALAVWTPSDSDRHRKTVIGIRTPRMGVQKAGLAGLLIGAFVGTFKVWIAAIVLFFLAFIPAGIANWIFGWVGAVLVGIICLAGIFWLLFSSLRGYVRMVRTWKSLGRDSAVPVASASG